MHFIEGHAVVRVVAGVGACAEFCADGNLRGEPDDGDADPVGD